PRRRRARQGAAQRRHAVPLPHRTGAAPHHPGTRGPHRTATRLTGRHFWTRRPVSRTFARPCENAAHERAAAEPACRRRGAGRARAAVPEAEPPRPPPGRRVSRATAGAPPHASRRPFPRGSRFMAGHRDDHPPGAAGSPMTADHGGHGGHAQHDGHNGHGGHGGHGGHEEQFRRLFWVMLLLAVPVVVFSGMFASLVGYDLPDSGWTTWISPVIGTVMHVWGGRPFLAGGVDEARSRRPGMMLLISLAITVAFIASWAAVLGVVSGELDFWWELALLIVIRLLGDWIEMRSLARTGSALDSLAALLPDEAERVEGDRVVAVDPATLEVGDVVLVRPGGSVPADGR